MTILGVPEGGGFTIGTSSNIAAPSGNGGSMDMSLDEMIKSRRSNRISAARSATTADKSIGKGRANRKAAMNQRRGITDSAKASAMDVEKEVFRQTRQSGGKAKKNEPSRKQPGRKARSEADIKTKARQEKKRKQEASKKKKAGGGNETVTPPTWIGGTRRPPSKKAVTAAVEAMNGAGFKVPKGMQMVISFAPAPTQDPTRQTSNNTPKKGGKKGNNRGGGGGGRGGKGGRGGGRRK